MNRIFLLGWSKEMSKIFRFQGSDGFMYLGKEKRNTYITMEREDGSKVFPVCIAIKYNYWEASVYGGKGVYPYNLEPFMEYRDFRSPKCFAITFTRAGVKQE